MLFDAAHQHRTHEPDDAAVFTRYRRFGAAGDREALVRRYLPLAGALASRYRHTSEPYDDLRQVASLGLLKAIERYEPGRGTAFSSFAVPTILGELRRHFRDTTWMVKVPRDVQELAHRCSRAETDLEGHLGRPATTTELAATLDTTPERVLEARQAQAGHRARPLDEAVFDDDGRTTFADLLGSEDPNLSTAEDGVTLQHLVGQLGEREQEVLRLRFFEDLKQAEIGERLGISQMHVSRLIRQSLERLQTSAATEPALSA